MEKYFILFIFNYLHYLFFESENFVQTNVSAYESFVTPFLCSFFLKYSIFAMYF